MSEKLTLTIKETAALLGVDHKLLYRQAKEGNFPAVRLGRRLIVGRLALDQWLGAKTQESSDRAEAAP